jgi:hypothetical protein
MRGLHCRCRQGAGNEENSDRIRRQLKKALDPKDRDAVEV